MFFVYLYIIIYILICLDKLDIFHKMSVLQSSYVSQVRASFCVFELPRATL
jgi:hypothetical protein